MYFVVGRVGGIIMGSILPLKINEMTAVIVSRLLEHTSEHQVIS